MPPRVKNKIVDNNKYIQNKSIDFNTLNYPSGSIQYIQQVMNLSRKVIFL